MSIQLRLRHYRARQQQLSHRVLAGGHAPEARAPPPVTPTLAKANAVPRLPPPPPAAAAPTPFSALCGCSHSSTCAPTTGPSRRPRPPSARGRARCAPPPPVPVRLTTRAATPARPHAAARRRRSLLCPCPCRRDGDARRPLPWRACSSAGAPTDRGAAALERAGRGWISGPAPADAARGRRRWRRAGRRRRRGARPGRGEAQRGRGARVAGHAPGGLAKLVEVQHELLEDLAVLQQVNG